MRSIEVGRRIAVVGTSGCGKTYVAKALAGKLGITYISNDAIIWRPNWQETPHEERVPLFDQATSADAWTFDGNLAARNPDDALVLSRCDTIVWLDLPRWQVWSQLVRRTIARIVTREELWHGNANRCECCSRETRLCGGRSNPLRGGAGSIVSCSPTLLTPTFAWCA